MFVVRSQDKEKIKVLGNDNTIYVIDTFVFIDGAEYGEYSTHEKAVEVVDDIFCAVRNLAFVDGTTFQMPQNNDLAKKG